VATGNSHIGGIHSPDLWLLFPEWVYYESWAKPGVTSVKTHHVPIRLAEDGGIEDKTRVKPAHLPVSKPMKSRRKAHVVLRVQRPQTTKDRITAMHIFWQRLFGNDDLLEEYRSA